MTSGYSRSITITRATMSTVHVYPDWEEHVTEGDGCHCQPDRIDAGKDEAGKPAVVISHRRRDN